MAAVEIKGKLNMMVSGSIISPKVAESTKYKENNIWADSKKVLFCKTNSILSDLKMEPFLKACYIIGNQTAKDI